MSVYLVLFLFCFHGYDRSYGEVLDPDLQPRQWQDVVSFVNQKISQMEQLMNIKDDRFDQLERNLRTQATEIASLKQQMHQKDTILSNLVQKVTDLEKRECVNNKSSPRMEPLDRVQLTGVSSSSVNRSSAVTDVPDDVRGDPDTQTAGIQNGDAQNGVILPKHFNRVAPPLPKQTVAFHAYRSTTITLGTQATVVFNHETLDQGDGYNPGDGIYTVPESGTYVITWTMFAFHHNAFQCMLVVNGVTRGISWTDSDEINDFHQTTGITVLTLTQNDHVFIRMGQIYHGKIFSSIAYSRPTFSGWKLD